MTRFLRAAGVTGMLFVLGIGGTGLADARPESTLREGHAAVTRLSANASAITYWVNTRDGWHVVTTVDTVVAQDGEAEEHAVVRFSSVLQPGQSQAISVPFAPGQQQQILRIRRLGEGIEVARVPGSP